MPMKTISYHASIIDRSRDLLAHTLSFLPPKTLQATAQVNKHWYSTSARLIQRQVNHRQSIPRLRLSRLLSHLIPTPTSSRQRASIYYPGLATLGLSQDGNERLLFKAIKAGKAEQVDIILNFSLSDDALEDALCVAAKYNRIQIINHLIKRVIPIHAIREAKWVAQHHHYHAIATLLNDQVLDTEI